MLSVWMTTDCVLKRNFFETLWEVEGADHDHQSPTQEWDEEHSKT